MCNDKPGTYYTNRIVPAHGSAAVFFNFRAVVGNDTTLAQGRFTGGRGLGLSIAKAIVTAHGGTVSAENNPNQVGSTFTVILPI